MKIVFLLYDHMTGLDLVGPHEVLTRLPGIETHRVALQAGPIHTDSGLTFLAEAPISSVTEADVLLIPGATTATTLQDQPQLLEWIQKIDQTTTWTTSVCTGSLILGASGLLKGLPATSHWAALERLSHFGALPSQRRVVESGKIITAAGVSAGIDMALLLAEKIAGTEVAQAIQLGIEYDPAPPFDTGSPSSAPPELVNALRAHMNAKFEPLDEL